MGANDNQGPDLRQLDTSDPWRRLLLRMVAQAAKSKIQFANSLGSAPSVAEKLNRKRFAQRIARKRQVKIVGSSHAPLPKQYLAFRYRENGVLTHLWPGRKEAWVPLHRRRRDLAQHIINIDRLSFIDDPAGVINSIQEIAEAEARHLDVRVNFNFDYVEDMSTPDREDTFCHR